jgi:small subunit ribosomal protein S17e
MGRVRTKTVKKYARIIVEKYYPKLTYDFKTNKALCKDVAVVQSARMRNQIAG